MKPEGTEELFNARLKQGEGAFVQLQVLRVAETTVEPQQHLRYRLALMVGGVCVLRFDNMPDKKSSRNRLAAHSDSTIDISELLTEFWRRVDDYNGRQP